MILRLYFILLVFLSSISPSYAATTWYVATTGNDSTGDGSSGNPWLTLQKCHNSAASGDTCIIQAGTYTTASTSQFVSISKSNLTFQSETPQGAKLNGQSNLTFTAFDVTTGGNGLTVKDFEMYGFSGAAVNGSTTNISNVTIIGNLIHDIGRNCSQSAFGQVGIFFGTGTTNLNISHNTFYSIGRFLNGESGCTQSTEPRGDHGIYIGNSNGLTIRHNIFYLLKSGFPIHLYPNAQANVVIQHNVFHVPVVTHLNGAIVLRNTITNLDISNNIFYHLGDQSPGALNEGATGPSNYAGTAVFKNNVLSDGSCVSTSRCNSIPGLTISGNLASTNPQLVDPTNHNYTLTASSSSLINAGLNEGLVFNGSAPDIGAYETFGFSSAVIDTNVMDVTLAMSLDTPVLPSASMTGFTVGCTGSNCGTPVVASAIRKTGSDSIIRLTISGIGGTGNCDPAQTWTVTYTSGSGNVTSTAGNGSGVNQPLLSFSTQPVTETCSGSGTPPPAGPYIQYEFEDGSGTNVNDSTANNLDGTLTNSPVFGTGHTSGGVVTTDSSTQYVAVPYGNTVNPSTQSLTIAFGVLVTSGLETADRAYFGTTGLSSNRLYISTGNGSWRIGIQSSDDGAASNLAVTSGWHRVCLNVDSGADTATLYLDGVAGTTGAAKTYTSYTLASDFRIGSPFSGSTPGATYDEFKVWQSVVSCATDFAAWELPPANPTGTFEQKTHKFQRLRKTGAGNPEDMGSNGGAISIIPGGAFQLIIQTDCTGANCDPVGQRLLYSKNGGAYTAVPDSFTADGISFYGTTSDTDIVSATVTCCLTGALTATDGITIFTSSAIPNVDLAQNASVVQRYVVKFDTTVTVGTTYAFRLYDQVGIAFDTYTTTPTVTIMDYAAGH